MKHLVWDCTYMNVTGFYWWQVILDLDDGLVPLGEMPLSEPMLTQIYTAVWHNMYKQDFLQIHFTNML